MDGIETVIENYAANYDNPLGGSLVPMASQIQVQMDKTLLSDDIKKEILDVVSGYVAIHEAYKKESDNLSVTDINDPALKMKIKSAKASASTVKESVSEVKRIMKVKKAEFNDQISSLKSIVTVYTGVEKIIVGMMEDVQNSFSQAADFQKNWEFEEAKRIVALRNEELEGNGLIKYIAPTEFATLKQLNEKQYQELIVVLKQREVDLSVKLMTSERKSILFNLSAPSDIIDSIDENTTSGDFEKILKDCQAFALAAKVVPQEVVKTIRQELPQQLGAVHPPFEQKELITGSVTPAYVTPPPVTQRRVTQPGMFFEIADRQDPFISVKIDNKNIVPSPISMTVDSRNWVNMVIGVPLPVRFNVEEGVYKLVKDIHEEYLNKLKSLL